MRIAVEAQLDPDLTPTALAKRLERVAYKISYWWKTARRSAKSHRKARLAVLRAAGVYVSQLPRCPAWPRLLSSCAGAPT